MATLAAGITYEMTRKNIQGTLPALTTLDIEAIGLPNSSTDKFIFINAVAGTKGSATPVLNHLRITSVSRAIGTETTLVGALPLDTDRVDFFTYASTDEPWRYLYPGDSLRLVVSSNSFSVPTDYNLIIWFTEVRFKGQFNLI